MFDQLLRQAKVLFAKEQPIPAGIAPETFWQAQETVLHLLKEASDQANAHWLAEAVSLNGYMAIKEGSPAFKVACAYACLTIMSSFNRYHNERSWLISLAAHLLRHWRNPAPEMLETILAAYSDIGHSDTFSLAKAIVSAVDKATHQAPLSSSLQSALIKFEKAVSKSIPEGYASRKDMQGFHNSIKRLLDGPSDGSLPAFLQTEPVGAQFFQQLQQEPAGELLHWAEWLDTCEAAGTKTKPTDKWLHQSGETLKTIPLATQVRIFSYLFDNAATQLQRLHKRENRLPAAYAKDWIPLPDWLAAAAWYAGTQLAAYPEARAALQKAMNWCFKKYPNVGPLSAKVGNACLRAFSLMPGIEGVNVLLRFKTKATNRNIQNLIETLFQEISKREGISRDDIEDLGVDTFGLNTKQVRIVSFGDYSARIAIEDQSRAVLEWRKPDGAPIKSVPGAVRELYKVDLKRLQIEFKELQGALSTQFARIENCYLEQRSWPYSVFEERFLKHPVLQTMAARLIWQFENKGQAETAIWHNGSWQNPSGELKPEAQSIVQLWHPMNEPPQGVLDWRDWLEQNRITQPFKQAYREIYVVTPPEIVTSSYSNRFAAHIIRQHQFAALCKLRNWRYTLQGAWDSHNIPRLDLAKWDYWVEYWVESNWNDAPTGNTGVFLYVHTDQVRFYYRGERVDLTTVPALLFSEVMRDVDLFVGVCSIGNDPDWQDTGDDRFQIYWNRYAFADELTTSGEVRKSALERLIPRLKIADQCHFDGKFLVVRGTRHVYNIHCGSGNIMMSPHNKYLCIVPDMMPKGNQGKIYLPFEGDRLLSIIISKALLLAEDDKIKDRTILAQL